MPRMGHWLLGNCFLQHSQKAGFWPRFHLSPFSIPHEKFLLFPPSFSHSSRSLTVTPWKFSPCSCRQKRACLCPPHNIVDKPVSAPDYSRSILPCTAWFSSPSALLRCTFLGDTCQYHVSEGLKEPQYRKKGPHNTKNDCVEYIQQFKWSY